MEATVVIPTYNGRERLLRALAGLAAQTRPADAVIVVDNGSSDGTAEALASDFPWVRVDRLDRNHGFGRAINHAALRVPGEGALVLVNNDTVCRPDFLERLLAPFSRPEVGMVAGVLVQAEDDELVDSAGLELDATLGSFDYGWHAPVARLAGAEPPVGPCGGAAAYRLPAFRELGGFDETLFAYWEDVDLALRLRAAGWACALAADARATHAKSATLGAVSPMQRRLDAFGRGYLLAKYRVVRTRPWRWPQVAVRDWPSLAYSLLVRREGAPIRARARGLSAGLARAAPTGGPPVHLATVSVREMLRRQWRFGRSTGDLPAYLR
jgi:N-acetylglucosaminyl-diphospho-decaprenol L-rhamnosyltransferase